jgi:rhodanese-related sulfurtransferase
MAAYVAENKMSGYGPSIMVSELDAFLETKSQVIVLDVRDVFAHQKSNMNGAYHLPLEMLQANIDRIPKDITILVYDETGKKGHQAARTLIGAGCEEVVNILGGHTSLQRHAIAVGFKNFSMIPLAIDKKSLTKEKELEDKETNQNVSTEELERLVIDVRTRGEFMSGAFPNALNIPLDDMMAGNMDLGENKDREIIVYCASGARSAYAQQVLKQRGYTNVTNGGGISAMMARG